MNKNSFDIEREREKERKKVPKLNKHLERILSKDFFSIALVMMMMMTTTVMMKHCTKSRLFCACLKAQLYRFTTNEMNFYTWHQCLIPPPLFDVQIQILKRPSLYTGDDVLNKFQRSITMLLWNKALWLDGRSHMTSFNQSECFISE